MSTLAESLRASTTLEDHEIEWVHLVVGDWQLIADLSFADLVLWVPSGLDGWRAVAHVRPEHRADGLLRRRRRPDLRRAGATRSSPRPTATAGSSTVASPSGRARWPCASGPSRSCEQGRALAVITQHTNVVGGPHPEPARADLPAARRVADPDDRGGGVPQHRPRRPAPVGARPGSVTASSTSTSRAPCSTRAPTRSAPSTGSGTAVTSSARSSRRWSPTCCRPRARRSTSRWPSSSPAGPLVDRGLDAVGERDACAPSRSPSGRRARRRDAAAARRLGAAAARAGAHHQGRDDPRDPPPGQEQPPDGGRAAATAVAAGPGRGRPQRPRRGGAPGRDDRARPRDAEPGHRRDGGLRRDRGARPAGRRRRRGHRAPGGVDRHAGRSDGCAPRTRPRSR